MTITIMSIGQSWYVLSLLLESLHWWDGVFILKRSCGAQLLNISLKRVFGCVSHVTHCIIKCVHWQSLPDSTWTPKLITNTVTIFDQCAAFLVIIWLPFMRYSHVIQQCPHSMNYMTSHHFLSSCYFMSGGVINSLYHHCVLLSHPSDTSGTIKDSSDASGIVFSAWWRHQMDTFSALLALCAGNSPVPVNCPHKGQWRGALMFSSSCAWINDWVNSREAGDLRCQRGHYDANVMRM